ncbi:MAG: sulfotransferase [Hellea sp.]|nr:sulfotransferase [Hellea sp.]
MSEAIMVSVDDIMQLVQSREITKAKEIAEDLVKKDPENSDALYALAVTQRINENFDLSLENLEKIIKIRPDFGRAYQEKGNIYFHLGENDKAIIEYRKALIHNNSLITSLRTLAGLLGKRGDLIEANSALESYKKLSKLPAELLTVRNMMAEKRYLKAENVCRSFMIDNPTHVEGMRLLADLGVKTNVLDDAEFILESAVEFEPENNLARFDYMNVLYRRQKYREALNQATLLLRSEPNNLDYKIGFANQSVAVGDYDQALLIYEEALSKVKNRSDLFLVYGHALKTIGKTDDAIISYRNSYAARNNFGDAYWSLANLKTYKFLDTEVNSMKNYMDDPNTSVDDQAHFCFALGKHYEDNSLYEDAFNCFKRGNDLRKSQLDYTPALMSQRFEAQKMVCDKKLFHSKGGMGSVAKDPIFIVGLPRAGSTLIEQILASHSKIEGTYELPNIAALAYELGGRRKKNEEPKYPACLGKLSSDQLKRFGESYISDTKVHRKSLPYFIDKMPNNFRHIGLISLILPNAKIIDARRNPMACCFSGFKQLFASGQEFTYGLDEIGTYYKDYINLMSHWNKVLPDKIYKVQYEDVVSNTEAEVRKLFKFLELPFEKECLDFYKTKRSVRTASSEQVRQPIYSSGVDQWRNYENFLRPLEVALGKNILKNYGSL